MGLGPLNDWDVLASYLIADYDFVHHVAVKLLPYGPLITPSVAAVVGSIALYSVHITRTIARKRATIDFFLKTEADKNIVDLFQNFDAHVKLVKKDIDDQMPADEIFLTSHYKTVHACLNMHELVAVGIENGVFDEKVARAPW
jgi:hypothetical protein